MRRRASKWCCLYLGKSIGVDDLKESPSTSIAAATSISTSGTNMEIAHDSSESDVEMSDASSDITADSEDCVADAASSDENSDNEPLCNKVQEKIKPQVGDFYIVQFQAGKRCKHYAGKVLHVDIKRRECEVKFARCSRRKSLIFSWPTVVDKSYVSINQMKCKLALQKEDKRGRIFLRTSELLNYKDSLE